MDVLISLNQGKTFISGAHTITASACVREDLLFLIRRIYRSSGERQFCFIFPASVFLQLQL